MTAEIVVYASFPNNLDQPLDLTANNWRWISCLTIPIDELRRLDLCRRPFKWIRFAIGAVLGAEGDLCHLEGTCVNYEDQLPPSSLDVYYHIDDKEKRRLYPLDPELLGHALTSSVSSRRDHTFHDDVMNREGGICLLSKSPRDICQAAHLVARSKGDSYIENFTRRRGRLSTDIVDSIDDPRNGIFINSYAHKRLGKEFAILTPNFAMTSTDIDPDMEATEQRFTSHLLQQSHESWASTLLCPGSSIIGPGLITAMWPPSIFFDGSYASAVLSQFASPQAKTEITSRWQDMFYPEGVITTAQAEQQVSENSRLDNADERNRRHTERTINRAADGLDMLDMIRFIGIPVAELPKMLKEREEKAKAVEAGRIADKVQQWRGALSSTAIL